MYLVTAGEMQQMDKETIDDIGIPGRILMENAGAGAFRFMDRVFPGLAESRSASLPEGATTVGTALSWRDTFSKKGSL